MEKIQSNSLSSDELKEWIEANVSPNVTNSTDFIHSLVKVAASIVWHPLVGIVCPSHIIVIEIVIIIIIIIIKVVWVLCPIELVKEWHILGLFSFNFARR